MCWCRGHGSLRRRARKARRRANEKTVIGQKGARKMSEARTAEQEATAKLAPQFRELTEKVLFGDIWERQELSKRDRSLITVAALVALNRTEQLRFHVKRALEN